MLRLLALAHIALVAGLPQAEPSADASPAAASPTPASAPASMAGPAASGDASLPPAAFTPAASAAGSPVQSGPINLSGDTVNSVTLPPPPPGTPVPGPSASATPTEPETAIPSASVPPDTPVQGQGVYPPAQWWCNDMGNGTYCPGVLLQDVELARIFPDSKTFVDKPTTGTLEETFAAWDALGDNVTVGQVMDFVQTHFKGEGLELEEVQIEGFNPTPALLQNVTDTLYRAWVAEVHGYWSLLIRKTNESALCQPGEGGCESSLIPLNHTIVVPGGRYREIYYWDSYWILQGLLKSELYTYAWNLLSNMMDLIEAYGFIPNGGRKYYLNRSQPPVFVQMVDAYVKVTGNWSVLERALPIMDEELAWWQNNRTMTVTSPWTNKTHVVAHYNVNNSAPRPEGYVEDWETAFGATPALDEQGRSDLYAELATGAESGIDYSSRWCREPMLNATDNPTVLRTLMVRAIVPVDLNALLAGDHSLLANLYETYYAAKKGGNDNGSGSAGGSPSASGSAPIYTATEVVNSAAATPSDAAGASAGTPSDAAASAPVGEPSEAPSAPAPEAPAGDASASAPADMPSADPTDAPAPSDAPMRRGTKESGKVSCTGAQGGSTGGPGSGAAPDNGKCNVPGNETTPEQERVTFHRRMSANYTAAILDLHWDEERAYFYDFNTSDNKRTSHYGPQGLYPLWQNITPAAVIKNETLALDIIGGLRYLLGKYPGAPAVSSVLEAGLNWDFPNVWPPHVYIVIRAIETLGRVFPRAQTINTTAVDFPAVPPNQLGVTEAELPPQPAGTVGNTSLFLNVTGPWPRVVATEIANRYMTAAFCSWYSTGGEIPGLLQQLPLSDLNATGSYVPGSEGHMYEKFNITDPDAAGGGGEYEVVIGFGWTNGVVLWAAAEYGSDLPQPTCPLIPILEQPQNSTGTTAPTPSGAGGGASGASSASSASAGAPLPSGSATAPDTQSMFAGGNKFFVGHRIPRSQ